MRYILSNLYSSCFWQALNKQKVRHQKGCYLPKYMKWQAPLWKVQYCIEKANIIPLSTLPLDETLIARCINIFKKYLKRLGIEDVAILNKLLIFKSDFLTIHNVTRTIYQCQEELHPIERFQFIKPIVGLFHLQMNVLKLLLDATWGKKGDQISLAHCKSRSTSQLLVAY